MHKLNGFTFYRSYYEAASELPDDLRLEFYDAVLKYGLDGVEKEHSGMAKAMFSLVKPNLESSRNKSKAGKLGGESERKQIENNPRAMRNQPVTNKVKTETKYTDESKYYQAAKWLLDHVVKNSPRSMKMHTESDIQKNANILRLMEEKDNIIWDDIKEVILWVVDDDFWKKVILSAGKLRKQYNQLVLKMTADQEKAERQIEMGENDNDIFYGHDDFKRGDGS